MGEGKDKSAPRTVVKPAWPLEIRTERKKCNVPQRRLPLLTFQVKREREREREREPKKNGALHGIEEGFFVVTPLVVHFEVKKHGIRWGGVVNLLLRVFLS